MTGLVGYLGRSLAAELHAWGEANRRTVDVPSRRLRPTEGFTGATLATVVVTEAGRARQIMLKVCHTGEWESARHRQALQDCPAGARPHLVDLPWDPWPTRDGRLLTFQGLAAGGGRLLSQLDPPDLGRACAHIADWLLAGWNEGTAGRRASTVGELLTAELGRSHGSVRALSSRLVDAPWIRTAPDREPEPNPLPLAHGSVAGRPLDVLVGRAHLDLHVRNAVVPVDAAGRVQIEEFQLIDLATYSGAGPLTADPASLLLSALAPSLADLPSSRWPAVLDAVVQPDVDSPLAVVPATRRTLVADGWAGPWRRQYLLSVVAAALRSTTFSLYDAALRWWYFQLAARAAAEVFRELGVRGQPADAPLVENVFATVPAPPAVADTTVRADLELAHAAGRARGPDAALALLAELLDRALLSLGPTHQDTLDVRYAYAVWTSRRPGPGQKDEGWRLMREVYGSLCATLGPDHPKARKCRKALDSSFFDGA